MDYLLCYIGKGINMQVKVKGAGGAPPEPMMMGSCVTGSEAAWFMRGMTIKMHAHLVVKLMSDMAEVSRSGFSM